MKLASLREGGRDGTLIIVNRDLQRAVRVPKIAATLQNALDNWNELEPKLEDVFLQLMDDNCPNSFRFDPSAVAAPLPRAYHWADASAYVTHVELVRRARGVELPETFWSDPLMYMGASDAFIGATDNIELEEESWGIDFEAEVAVFTDDVPAGTDRINATSHIKLVSLVNDVSLRNLIPAELSKQFGFYQSKAQTAFSPVAVTPDELGEHWDGERLHLPLHATLNGKETGQPNAGVDMTFGFTELIQHATKTRGLVSGSVIGSGTVSNQGNKDGSCCIAEIRCLETIADGTPTTPFMSFGDRIEIEMFDTAGQSIFGKIDQQVSHYDPSKKIL
jgi:fumarylacetoacetate (FAA) hydrolase